MDIARKLRGRKRGLLLLLVIFLIVTFSALSAGCSSEEKAADFHAEGRKLMEQGNADGAVVFFKNALEKNATDFSVRFDLGKAYFKLGKLDQADEEFQKCLLQQPNNPALNFEAAKVALLQRKQDKTLAYVRMAEKGASPSGETRELAALAYMAQNKLAESEACLKEALALEPGRRSASIGLARVCLSTARPTEALALVDKLLAEDENFVDALHLRADIAMAANELDTAIVCYEKLIRIQPGDAVARYLLGTALLRQGKDAEAVAVRDAFQKNVKSSPHLSMLNGLIAFQADDFAGAAAYFQNSIDAQPSTDGYYRLAIALQRTGDLESALSSLHRLLDSVPGHAPGLHLMAQIYMEQGRVAEAQAVAEKIANLYPDVARSHYLLGTVLKAAGKHVNSLASLQRALEINPAMSEASLTRSSVLMTEKRFSEARDELNKAIEQNSGNTAARAALFNYYLGRNDLAEAGRVVSEGLAELPDNAMLLTMQASLFATRKEEAKALASLSKAKQSAPDFLPAFNLELRLHMLAGRNRESLALCDDYLSRHPDAVDQLIASAAILDALDRFDEATARLRKAHSLGAGRALFFLVQREVEAGRPEKAEKLFLEELDASPTPELRSGLTELYLRQGTVEKAWAIYDALETTRPHEAVLGKYRLLAATRKYDEALNQARMLSERDPSSPLGPLSVASSLENLGRGAEALEELEKAYRANQSPVLLVSMAQLCTRMGQYGKAEAFYGTALRLNADDRQALMGQGYVYMKTQKYAQAIANFERSIELAPEDVAAVNNLAMAYAESGKATAKAVDLATKALILRPENAQILDTLAFCLLADNRAEDAVRLLKNTLAAHPNSAGLHYRLGAALLRAGKKEEGLEKLKKALDLGPFDDVAVARDLIDKNK